eukprot:2535276-Alexandrium_andersonii.AAC.1
MYCWRATAVGGRWFAQETAGYCRKPLETAGGRLRASATAQETAGLRHSLRIKSVGNRLENR